MKNTCIIIVCFILGGIGSIQPAFPETDNRVMTVYYFDRPPYYMTQNDNTPYGFMVDITEMVLNRAGVPHSFVELPPKRILHQIAQDEYSCSIGWFKNPERKVFAQFSDAIYQNRPMTLVMRRSLASSVSEKPTLRQILTGHRILGIVNGFSYGSEIDAAIAEYHPPVFEISGDPQNLLKMIYNERLDMVFMAPEEAGYIISKDSALQSDLKIIEIADSPDGNKRYLMFSNGVDGAIIDRINNAIDVVKKSEKYQEIVTHADSLSN